MHVFHFPQSPQAIGVCGESSINTTESHHYQGSPLDQLFIHPSISKHCFVASHSPCHPAPSALKYTTSLHSAVTDKGLHADLRGWLWEGLLHEVQVVANA